MNQSKQAVCPFGQAAFLLEVNMKNKLKNHNDKTPGPFGNDATAHLINMGILHNDGTANESNMAAFTAIFSWLFYIDLRQFYENTDNIAIIYNLFSALHSKRHYHHMYLLYSIQYDYFKKPLPDPVWWIAGTIELVGIFMDGFMERLEKLLDESGIFKTSENDQF
jgi:hypothetical protein